MDSSFFFCWIGLLVTPAYGCLTVVALLSTLLPFLKDLASHGKTTTTTTTTTTSSSKSTADATTIHHNKDNDKKKKNGLNNNHQDLKKWCWNNAAAVWYTTCTHYVRHGGAFWIHKRFFLHFYVVGLLSLVAFIIITVTSSNSFSRITQDDDYFWGDGDVVVTTTMVLLSVHLIRRCWECIMVQRYSNQSSKMHVVGYICGLFHYLFLPYILFPVVCDTHTDTDTDGNNNNQQHSGTTAKGFFYLPTVWYCSGCVILCLWAQLEQFYHHSLLASLRTVSSSSSSSSSIDKNTTTTTTSSSTTTTSSHKIPRGRWFHYISCPHYLAEILIYTSLILLLQQQQQHSGTSNNDMSVAHVCGNTNANNGDQQERCNSIMPRLLLESSSLSVIPSLFPKRQPQQQLLLLLQKFVPVLLGWRRSRHVILLLWVTCNLTVTALRSHEWYHQTFPTTYATLKRKAIFPWIL